MIMRHVPNVVYLSLVSCLLDVRFDRYAELVYSKIEKFVCAPTLLYVVNGCALVGNSFLKKWNVRFRDVAAVGFFGVRSLRPGL
jgi:hypothetical protein